MDQICAYKPRIFLLHLHVPVSTASASFAFQCFAMLSERGSSGFGALSSAWMLKTKYYQEAVR